MSFWNSRRLEVSTEKSLQHHIRIILTLHPPAAADGGWDRVPTSNFMPWSTTPHMLFPIVDHVLNLIYIIAEALWIHWAHCNQCKLLAKRDRWPAFNHSLRYEKPQKNAEHASISLFQLFSCAVSGSQPLAIVGLRCENSVFENSRRQNYLSRTKRIVERSSDSIQPAPME